MLYVRHSTLGTGKQWFVREMPKNVEKIPKTKDEIQRLIIAELRTFAQCEKAWGIVVVPIVDDTGIATWTVSRFHRGQSNAYACDRALQRIVPHYQRLYDLAQKH